MADNPKAMPLDMSLQMFVAFGSYKTYLETGKPKVCVEPDR
jgi:hypothetical protein